MLQNNVENTEVFDKRIFFREKHVEFIRFSHFNEDGSPGSRGEGFTVDLSPVGMQIQIDRELPVNTKIFVEIHFAKEFEKYTGEIAWIKKIEENLFAVGIRVLFKKLIFR